MLQLTPSAIKTAKENLAAYVEHAKSLDIMHSQDAPKWEDPTWDVSAFTKLPNAAVKSRKLQFRPLKKRRAEATLLPLMNLRLAMF